MKFNFTDGLRKALAIAREEAIRLQHDYVGTEHLLLGLIRSPTAESIALRDRLNLQAEMVRERIDHAVRRGRARVSAKELPYTSRAKKVLEHASAFGEELGDAFTSTEHLFMGLVREEKGIAAQVLGTFGVTEGRLRAVILECRGGQETAPLSPPSEPGRAEAPVWFLEIEATSSSPIYEQIIARVEEAVATGRLQPGERLPAVRELASELGVAPGTVARAYSALESKGVLETEGARGTRVALRAARQAVNGERADALVGLLRPVAVAAFHMNASAADLRAALERAMRGIYPEAMPQG